MIELLLLFQLACFHTGDQEPAGIYIYRAPLDDLQSFDWYGLMIWPQTVFDLPPDGDEYCYKCEFHYRIGLGQWRTELSPVDKDCQERAGCHST